MRTRLSPSEMSEIVNVNELRIGERIRLNHSSHDCKGGSEAAILSRNDDGYSFFCFRCGCRGFAGVAKYYTRPAPRGEGVARCSGMATAAPDDAHGEWRGWPGDVREWLTKAGMNDDRTSRYGIVWSDREESLWIPVRQYSRITTGFKHVGYVKRGFNPKSYLTKTHDKDEFYGYYVKDTEGVEDACETVVLVEDVISAIRVSEVIDCISIMGVHPKPATVSKVLTEKYKNAIVFLDGDNPTVRMKARQIGKRLPFVNVRVVDIGKDPKHCTKHELEGLLTA